MVDKPLNRREKLFNYLSETRLGRYLSGQWENHPVRLVGRVLAVGAIIFIFLDFIPGKVFEDFSANAATELISIVITILVIDRLNERRQDKQLKEQLTRDLLSNVSDFAVRAVNELRYHGWLDDVLQEVKTAHLPKVTPQGLKMPYLWRANLKGVKLREAHLEGAYLNKAHLEGADLWRAHLEGAYLRKARLEGANLEEAHLEGADLWKAHLEGAYLNKAHLEGANLWGAHLEGANLWRARLERGNSIGEGVILVDAHLEGANLEEAQLEGANLLGAHLEDANLLFANLRDASVTDKQLLSAMTLQGATMPDGRRYEEWILDRKGQVDQQALNELDEILESDGEEE